jgi:sulfotransferase family protein
MTSSTDRRVPDFFIVGHHKSGTTALYEMLRRHPQIFMPDLKEPRWFASDLRALMAPKPGTLPETLEEYLALFDGAREDQLLGEASPSYLRSEVAARKIAELQPAARNIAILREPASFVRSYHFQLVQEHVERQKDLGRAVAAEQIERAGRQVRRYSDHVDYVSQLRRFHEVFGREQVLVLIYDDFRADNEASVRGVLRFLGVDDLDVVPVMEANPTVAVRSVRLDGAIRSLQAGRNPLTRGLKAGVRTLLSERGRERVRGARRKLSYAHPSEPDEALMRDLRRRYRDQVVALSDYLGRDLVTLWGYDRLD